MAGTEVDRPHVEDDEAPRRWLAPGKLRRSDRFTQRREDARSFLAASLEREAELGRLALWAPVVLGLGILIYFALPSEPSLVACLLSTAAAATVAFVSRWRIAAFRFWVAVALVLAGMSIMTARTASVTTPIIASDYTGDLTGWVESIEQTSANVRRLVVVVETLEDLAPSQTPRKVRITVRARFDEVRIGSGISGLVALFPPPGPVMPGGYDFGRDLFYEGIGGSGFSYGAPDIADIGPPPGAISRSAPIEALRTGIANQIRTALPGEAGAIAAALVTGDRSGISEETTEALRISGLGHILAISGLHMALVVGSVFGGLRALLALSPSLALRRPIKKWAAAGALGAAVFYLVLSGASVSTQRSFVMVAVVLFAVLLDRRAFSVRNVAVAAMIILLLTPEALLTVSFQMSFAATLALIAGFEYLAERRRVRVRRGPVAPRTVRRTALYWIGGLALTSLLAGLATTPFAAFHFNRTAPFSLIANLAAMPFFTFLVMPMALFAVLLMPFGLEGLPLGVMSWGLDIVTGIAGTVSGWTGAAGLVPSVPLAALLIVSLGLLWLCLWRERWRIAGVPIMVLGLGIGLVAPRPDILIEEGGEAVAVRGPDGRYLMMGGNAEYEFETWLRADADPRLPGDDTLEEGVFCDTIGCTAPLADTGLRVALSNEPAALAEDCRMAAIVVTPFDAPAECAALVIDGRALAAGGAHAIYLGRIDGEGQPKLAVATARPETRRPWMPSPAP